MNSAIKISLFISFTFIYTVHANSIKIIVPINSKLDFAKNIELTLKNKYHIPQSLINITKSNKCEERSFTLCTNKKGELKKISFERIENFKKTFSIFNLELKNEL